MWMASREMFLNLESRSVLCRYLPMRSNNWTSSMPTLLSNISRKLTSWAMRKNPSATLPFCSGLFVSKREAIVKRAYTVGKNSCPWLFCLQSPTHAADCILRWSVSESHSSAYCRRNVPSCRIGKGILFLAKYLATSESARLRGGRHHCLCVLSRDMHLHAAVCRSSSDFRVGEATLWVGEVFGRSF